MSCVLALFVYGISSCIGKKVLNNYSCLQVSLTSSMSSFDFAVCFSHLISGMVLGGNTSTAEEYRRAYPAKQEHFKQIKKEETIYRSIAQSRKMGTSSYTDADFTAPQYFVKRWGRCLIDYEHLMEFLSPRDRKVGDIYERCVYPAYQSNSCFQTMRNTAVLNQIYEFGKVYVGFGFVDFFQLLWGKYIDIDNESLQLRFHGFDMSRVVH